ncbi:putative tannase [Rosellinia necatrix]|uniref:Carboxylic ester hydrolase n=1 Tax=Rosellinia necatrix TaxID=77044 RepID=A0A1S7ULK0_ROSNE|nr:putative tannase [Rosellinia necatrix]
MRGSSSALALSLGSALAAAQATSLAELCTVDYVTAALPVEDLGLAVTIDPSSVTAALSTNRTVGSAWYPSAVVDYCTVTFAYSHDGLHNDTVHVSYLVPAPGRFANRYLSTGGGGLAINSGAQYTPSGIVAGAVAGITDGGFGSFATQFDAAFLRANGTVDWQATYMFGYQAHRELAVLGKRLARNLFAVPDADRLYAYYQGCSEGGREGWSQAQRFADQFDGLVTGAPALRFSQLQTNHLSGGVLEEAAGYYPPPCELEKIRNLTIAACDALDGRADGVVARSDLCRLEFDYETTVGAPYYCAASAGGGFPGSGGATPEQNGTVTAEAVAIAKAFTEGLIDSEGRRVYLNPQPGSTFADARTSYDAAAGTWTPAPLSLGGGWITRFLRLEDKSNLDTLAGVTVDQLRDWMAQGMQTYYDSLQTTWPALGGLRDAGAKVLVVHGEADSSIPAGSSVHYYESVRRAMYGDLAYRDGTAALDDFLRLFLVPGAEHCGSNAAQPGAGWPATTLQTVIDWVENGVAPATLNTTGQSIGSVCRWPLRPLWSANGTEADCVFDQKSVDSWMYEFDAFKFPVY